MTTPIAAGPGFPRAAPSVFTRYRTGAEYAAPRRFDNLPSPGDNRRRPTHPSTEEPAHVEAVHRRRRTRPSPLRNPPRPRATESPAVDALRVQSLLVGGDRVAIPER